MPPANHWVVTAKFTEDGSNSWRRADGSWSRQIAEAGLLVDEASATALAATARVTEQREISDPYVIAVYASTESIDPLSARERIRANGPTIRVRRPD
ncbi:MAG: DUF2849 domain-containing protein [Kofleriaceae bacterium]